MEHITSPNLYKTQNCQLLLKLMAKDTEFCYLKFVVGQVSHFIYCHSCSKFVRSVVLKLGHVAPQGTILGY
jgi:hypothetical protein